ncbi:hypothetical protein BC832DRAFT_557267 [Gaertneriomyces semiglobifer]|nr:hypothetical protein BC832DRAFT_557267 [Gaertneriomyces semiglobifer]
MFKFRFFLRRCMHVCPHLTCSLCMHSGAWPQLTRVCAWLSRRVPTISWLTSHAMARSQNQRRLHRKYYAHVLK